MKYYNFHLLRYTPIYLTFCSTFPAAVRLLPISIFYINKLNTWTGFNPRFQNILYYIIINPVLIGAASNNNSVHVCNCMGLVTSLWPLSGHLFHLSIITSAIKGQAWHLHTCPSMRPWQSINAVQHNLWKIGSNKGIWTLNMWPGIHIKFRYTQCAILYICIKKTVKNLLLSKVINHSVTNSLLMCIKYHGTGLMQDIGTEVKPKLYRP